MITRRQMLVACATLLTLAACSDDTKKKRPFEGPLLPLVTGNSWTYRVTDGSDVDEKTISIGEQRTVGGDGPNAEALAFEVTSQKGKSSSVSMVADLDGKLVRYVEEERDKDGDVERSYVWTPHRVWVDGSDEHREEDASWLEEAEELSTKIDEEPEQSTLRERWTVLSARESVTVPAGTFDAIKLQKAGGSSLKTYWYVPGLGKVKETGGQVEELIDFDVKE
jgi:hypothetical protein